MPPLFSHCFSIVSLAINCVRIVVWIFYFQYISRILLFVVSSEKRKYLESLSDFEPECMRQIYMSKLMHLISSQAVAMVNLSKIAYIILFGPGWAMYYSMRCSPCKGRKPAMPSANMSEDPTANITEIIQKYIGIMSCPLAKKGCSNYMVYVKSEVFHGCSLGSKGIWWVLMSELSRPSCLLVNF